MLFHNGQPHFLAKPLVPFNNTTVAYTSDTKFFGIQITHSLKCHSHIQLLANKLSKVTFMIKTLKEKKLHGYTVHQTMLKPFITN